MTSNKNTFKLHSNSRLTKEIIQYKIVYLGCRVNGELEFALLAVVDGEAFHEEGGESGAGAAAERVENEESLQAGAHVGQLADAVEDHVHDLLADGVVAARVVVGRVLLARDQLLRVEQLPVRSSAHFI